MTTNTCVPGNPAAAATGTRRTWPVDVLRRWYAPLFEARTWKETLALLVALPAGIVTFTVVVTGVAVSTSLALTVVGLPLLIVLLYAARRSFVIEGAAARRLLGAEVTPLPPPSAEGTIGIRAKRAVTHRPSWKAVGHALALLPVGIVTFTTTVVLWTVGVALTTLPLYQAWSDTEDVPDALSSFVHGWGRVGSVTAAAVVGLVVLGATPRLVHGLAATLRRFVCSGGSLPATTGV